MDDFYLYRLFRSNKMLFIFVLVFIFFQIYFNQKRIHSFPWFVWDMYSRPYSPPNETSVFVIALDGKIYNHTQLPIWKEEIIFKTNKMYNWQVIQNFQDPMKSVVDSRTRFFKNDIIYNYTQGRILNNKSEYEYAYKIWFKNYVNANIGSSFKTLEFKEIKLKFIDNKFQPIDTLIYYSVQND